MTARAACVAVAVLGAAAASAEPHAAWSLGATGRGTAHWTEHGDRLIYRGGAPFGWGVVRNTAIRDGFVQVQLKPVGGRQDRAGGVVWRWRDANNYYVARAHALAGNVVAFRMVNGRRADLVPVEGSTGPAGVRASVTSGRWHTLRVDFRHAEFTVIFAGRRLFSVRDDSLGEAGAVGVWSKADSVTEFRALEYGTR